MLRGLEDPESQRAAAQLRTHSALDKRKLSPALAPNEIHRSDRNYSKKIELHIVVGAM